LALSYASSKHLAMDDIAEKDFEKLQSRLKELNCPLTEDCSESWIKELLLNPGDSRMNLFGWILESISIKMFTKFQQFTTSDAKARYLSKVFADLGYCNRDNMKIIQGTAPTRKQAKFFLSLLNAISCLKQTTAGRFSSGLDTFSADGSVFPLPDVTLVNFSSTSNASEDPKMLRFQFIDAIDNIADNYIVPKIENALPLDIQKILKEKTKKTNKAQRSAQTLSMLQSSVEASAAEIERLDSEIEGLPATVYPSEETTEKLSYTIGKAFSTCSAYRRIHANEILPNCTVRVTALSELGPICSSTRESLQYIFNINDNISLFKRIQSDIKQHKQWLEKLVGKRGSKENPDTWIHEYKVFNPESVKILRSSLSSSYAGTQSSLMNTFREESTLT